MRTLIPTLALALPLALPLASVAAGERSDCLEGGRFPFAVFGWMVHVYPFEDDPDAVFRHPSHHQQTMP